MAVAALRLIPEQAPVAVEGRPFTAGLWLGWLAGLFVLALVSAGCARDSASDPADSDRRQAETPTEAEPSDEVSSTRLPDEPAGHESDDERIASSRADSPQPAWESEDLAGMYNWDPEGGFHNAEWSGTLAVEHPCVYLKLKSRNGAAIAPGEALRSFVRLPEPLTRYDASTDRLWVGGNGPMTTGDEVVLVGSEGWQQHWNQPGEDTNAFEIVRDPHDRYSDRAVCIAHVSFWAAAINPVGVVPASAPKTSELPGLGLFPWDPDFPQLLDGYSKGVLRIEPPCVYIEDDRVEPLVRYLVSLPRPLVRYDADAGVLWFHEHGPFTTGDRVLWADALPSGSEVDFVDAGCSLEDTYGVEFIWPCPSPSESAECVYRRAASAAAEPLWMGDD